MSVDWAPRDGEWFWKERANGRERRFKKKQDPQSNRALGPFGATPLACTSLGAASGSLGPGRADTRIFPAKGSLWAGVQQEWEDDAAIRHNCK